MITIRDWLVQFRKKNNMPQTKVANLAGISESYYAMIELEQRRPSVDVAQAIAYVLNFDWQLFFPNKNSDAKQEDTA